MAYKYYKHVTFIFQLINKEKTKRKSFVFRQSEATVYGKTL